MGYNTPALFLNDAAGDIARDRDLGEKIAQAMTWSPAVHDRNGRVDLSVGNHGNAVSILKPQHSNDSRLLHLHGNLLVYGPHAYGASYNDHLSMVEAAALSLGYDLVKR